MPTGPRTVHHLSTPVSHVGMGEALGQSEAFLAFQERLSRAARVNRPVLCIGERGTGKELAVSKLHYLSPRWQGPLVALNCAALSPALIESELFGHEEGAFTGATGRRTGARFSWTRSRKSRSKCRRRSCVWSNTACSNGSEVRSRSR